MTPQTKKIIIWSSVAVIIGVGGYFLYNYIKNNPSNSNNNSDGNDGKDDENKTPTPTPTIVDTNTPSVNPSSVNVPANLNLILQRLGKRASLKSFGKNSFVVITEWNTGNRKYTFNFFDNDVYKVFNEGGFEIFNGKYTDAGRGLSIAKDNYSRTSKVGSTFTTDSFWKTGAKLFTDKK
jgi:hypothetical protein